MANNYFQTATGYGYVENDGPIPEGATPITQAQYDALVQAAEDAAAAAAAQAIADAKARWTTVHTDLVAAGVSDAAARILAGAVGIDPAAG
jgi:hypothetical protein